MRLLAIAFLTVALSAEAALSPPYLIPIGTNTAGSWWITKPSTNRISNYEGWETANTNAVYFTNLVKDTSNALQSAISAIPGGQTQWPVSAITNAGTAAYSNAAAFLLAGGKALTAGTADTALAGWPTQWPLSAITNAGTAAASDTSDFLAAGVDARFAAKTNSTIYDNILFAKTDSANYWWQTNDTAKQQLRFLGEASTEPLAIDWSDGAGYGIHTPNIYASAGAYVPITNAGYIGTDGNGKIVVKSAPAHTSMWEFNITATTTDDTPKPIYTNAWPANGRRFVRWEIQATSADHYFADAGYTVFNRTNGCDTPTGVRMGITGYAEGGEQVAIQTNSAGCVWTVTGNAGETYTWRLVGYSDGYWNSQ